MSVAKDSNSGEGWSSWSLPAGLSGPDEARLWRERAREAVEAATQVHRQALLHEWFEWVGAHPRLSTASVISGRAMSLEDWDEQSVFLEIGFADGSRVRSYPDGFSIKAVHEPAPGSGESWGKAEAGQAMLQALSKLGECVPEWDELLLDASLPMEWSAWRSRLFTAEEIAAQERSVVARAAEAGAVGVRPPRL